MSNLNALQHPMTPSTKSALEESANAFLHSPQAMIRSFLQHALPDFPSLSMGADDSLEHDMSRMIKAIALPGPGEGLFDMTQDSSDSALEESSLSLPESFLAAPMAPRPALGGAQGAQLTALQADHRMLETKCARLTSLLEQEMTGRLQAEADARELQLQRTLRVPSAATAAAAAEAAAMQSGQIELLSADKQHLQAEVDTLKIKLQAAIQAQLQAQSKALGLEEQVRELTERLLANSTGVMKVLDDKVEREVQRIREDTAAELASLKNTASALAARETQYHQEIQSSLQHELMLLKQENDKLSIQNKSLQEQLLDVQQKSCQEIGEWKSEVKMKGFELVTLGVAFEQRMGQLRHVELELEAAKQEIQAHKSALLRMEAESSSSAHALQSALTACRQRLEAYEALEVQVDEAVLSQHPGRAVHMPSHPERRLQQAVQLATKLMECEKDKADLAQQVQDQQATIQQLEESLATATQSLSRAAQPTAYLVSKLRDEEALRVQWESKCKEWKKKHALAEQHEQEAQQESAGLRDRLAMLMQQRNDLAVLKDMLQQIADKEEDDAEDSHSDASDEEEDQEDDENHPLNLSLRSPPRGYPPSSPTHAAPMSPVSSPMKPTSPVSLSVRANRLGVTADALAKMLTPPRPSDKQDLLEDGAQEASQSPQKVLVKGYKRQ